MVGGLNGRGMHGREHAWQRACVAGGVHGRGMCGVGCVWWGACIADNPTGVHYCLFMFKMFYMFIFVYNLYIFSSTQTISKPKPSVFLDLIVFILKRGSHDFSDVVAHPS